jgi:hypothetical protein
MFMGPRNRFQGMISASLCSLAGRYNNLIPPRFLAPIDFLKIPALANEIVDPVQGEHGLIKLYKHQNQMPSFKKLTCKGALRQVFFGPVCELLLSPLLSGSNPPPYPCEKVYFRHVYSV